MGGKESNPLNGGNIATLLLAFGGIIAAIFAGKALGGSGTTSSPSQSGGGGGKPCNCGL